MGILGKVPPGSFDERSRISATLCDKVFVRSVSNGQGIRLKRDRFSVRGRLNSLIHVGVRDSLFVPLQGFVNESDDLLAALAFEKLIGNS